MPAKRVTPEQAIGRLREAEVLLGQGATIGGCQAEYSGMRVDQAKRLKELETGNSRLNKIVADQALDLLILKEAASANS